MIDSSPQKIAMEDEVITFSQKRKKKKNEN